MFDFDLQAYCYVMVINMFEHNCLFLPTHSTLYEVIMQAQHHVVHGFRCTAIQLYWQLMNFFAIFVFVEDNIIVSMPIITLPEGLHGTVILNLRYTHTCLYVVNTTLQD